MFGNFVARWLGACVVFIGLLLATLRSSNGQNPVETDTAPARGTNPEGDADTAQAAALEKRVQKVIAERSGSVVAIYRHAKRSAGTEKPTTLDEETALGFGSGVIIDSQGFVLTNQHVLGDWQTSSYSIWHAGKAYPAELKAGDPWLDLAVLKIPATALPAVKFGNGEGLKKGAFVVAIGNLSGVSRDGEPSASFGVVSNLHRSAPSRLLDRPVIGDAPTDEQPSDGRATLHHYGTLLQTTANLELGSSGGLLVNLQGEMVGLTISHAALIGYERPGGFAIPVDETFLRAVEQLRSGRQPSYGFLGIAPAEVRNFTGRPDAPHGALVANVVPGTPASAAGIKVDDIVTHVDGHVIQDDVELIRRINGKPAGATVELTLAASRDGTEPKEARKVKVHLGKRPPDPLRPGFSEVTTPEWRGMKVDYATACPNFQQVSRALEGKAAVGVVEVQANSLAWQAGLRPGDFVALASGKACGTPEQFLQNVAADTGPVQLTLLGNENNGGQASLQRTVGAGAAP